MPVPHGLREAVAGAVARTVTGYWPTQARRPAYRERITSAVMAAIEPIVAKAIDDAVIQAEVEAHNHAMTRLGDHLKAADVAYRSGYEKGQAAGRATALREAAAMLKRHGHRSAVTRVQALLDDATAAVTSQTPARPQPVNASPAGGPGPSEPQDGIYDYGTRTWHPVPTPPENGAQRGVQGPTAAHLRDVRARRG